MKKQVRTFLLAAMTSLALVSTGCTVMRGQESVGSYVDDATITAQVKTKLLQDPTTGGLSINVDTLDGTVALSGFAKSQTEKTQADALARSTKGVKAVRNNLIVRPPTQ